ncbi:MAG: cysteine peptidase family C39 domain-containing protein [Planctomycetota bacterium]
MRWMLAIFFLAGYAGAFWIGRRAAQRYKKRSEMLLLPCLAAMLFYLLLYYSPQLEFDIFRFHGYLYVRPWWMPVLVFFFFGLAFERLELRRKRVGIAILAGLVGILYCMRLGAFALAPANHLNGQPRGPSGVCMQTSGYSCGAAAAATLLAQIDVQASEAEMAELCGTNAMMGTDTFSEMCGLREKLRGTRYTLKLITHATLEDIRGLRYPALATMHLTTFIDHWIVVTGADEQGVRTLDPLRGADQRSIADFMGSWRGDLVELVPKGGR